MTPILAFYSGAGRDAAGRTLAEIWAFGPAELERRHDFIQWLFPLREASRFNPLAPVLTQQDEEAFRADPGLRARLLHSLDVMLAFYGLRRNGEAIEPVSSVDLAHARWLSPGDHNHLRLSRIVQSLALLGEEQWASALKACLLAIARNHPARISRETVEHWSRLLEDGAR